MRIENIKLKNFLSFGSTELDLKKENSTKSELYIITGKNLDEINEEYSNGSGKSCVILESATYNLFSRLTRANNKQVKGDNIVRFGEKNLECAISYRLNNGNLLKIKRTKNGKAGSNVDIELNGLDINKRTKTLNDDDISSYTNNMNVDIWLNAIIYYTNNIDLLQMNYSQRLDFFKNLISLEFLDDYYDKVKLFREENNKFLVQLEEKKNANKKIIEIIEENNDEYIIFLNDKIKEMRNEYSNLNKQLERLETTEEYDEKILEIEKDKSDINKSIKEIQNEINLINGNISICKKKINDANKEIKTLDDLSGINCPICKQPVSEEYVHDCSKIYKEIIDSNSELIIEYNKDIAKWNITKEKCDERINEFDKKIKEINNKKNEINMERSKIQGQINSVVKDGKKYKSELENLTNKDSDKNGKKSIYEMKDRCLTKAIETRNIWKTKSDFWYEMFAPKSALRTQILKKYVNVLSDMFEFYLSRLYNNEITGKILIDPDNGNIDIVLTKGNGDEISYFGLSSGERKRATIGIFLSLFEFYSYLNSQSPKFMILDEIFDSLDKPGVKLVVETIKEEIINRLNIDVFIISHIDVQEYLDDYTEIEVIKKDNISSASIKKKLN